MAIKRPDFPLPDVTDPLTAGFFSAASRGQLEIPRCDSCRRWVWYPEKSCTACRGTSLTWTPTSGRGRLFSWAVVHRAFLPAFADMVPFVTALVALDEDPRVRIVTYVVDSSVDELRADLPVQAVFRELRFATVPDRSVTVPMFRSVS